MSDLVKCPHCGGNVYVPRRPKKKAPEPKKPTLVKAYLFVMLVIIASGIYYALQVASAVAPAVRP